LVLSCNGQNIVLSCILYDLDLTHENGKEQFQRLFKKADEYDDRLKTTYGCIDRLVEK
jgi:serine protease Do